MLLGVFILRFNAYNIHQKKYCLVNLTYNTTNVQKNKKLVSKKNG